MADNSFDASATAMHTLPARVVVVGISGAGKSTLAHSLAAISGALHIELDSLFWGPDWAPKPQAEFRALTLEAVSASQWVVDGNYSVIRDIVWPRAGAIVWLNYSLPRVFWQVLRRTLYRLATGQVLWHGNRESIGRTFLSRESILVWVLTAYGRRKREFEALRTTAAFPHAIWVELRSPRETVNFLHQLQRSASRRQLAIHLAHHGHS